MQKQIITLALIALTAAPAYSQWSVIDVSNIEKTVQVVNQDTLLVNSARQNLEKLQNIGNLANLNSEISAVTTLLQKARASCFSAPASCNVAATVANTQLGQLTTDMGSKLTELQNAAKNVTGALQAGQLNALADIQVANELMQIQQQQTADALQKQADDARTVQIAHPCLWNPATRTITTNCQSPSPQAT